MRSVLTTIPLALTLSVLSLAYPTQWNNQQLAFTHINRHGANHATETEEGYARFDEDKVFRIEISSVAELKQLEETIEVKAYSGTSKNNKKEGAFVMGDNCPQSPRSHSESSTPVLVFLCSACCSMGEGSGCVFLCFSLHSRQHRRYPPPNQRLLCSREKLKTWSN